MSKHRYTIETLASGQPRPYADSIYRHRITYEWQGPFSLKGEAKDAPFILCEKMNEQIVRRDCKHFSGWMEEGEGDWASTRLVYLKQVSPGVWEWETRAAYTD